ncbi:tripartite tricarboxylate transporter substrate binding protein [Pigmentiphaga soli]|uniref:Tripartite tricarboxylate transporter substrate binding protein n=1 Tax=Pigmentiphaga soli TaxID=1007095 RepID=A0ABP8HL68_9BURK
MKKSLSIRASAFLSSTLIAAAAAGAARAEDGYPSRPIKIEVPFAAGGTGDQFARILGRKMQQALNQSLVVENRVGAASNIGMGYVARSAPDGYTLLMAGQPLTVNPSLYEELPYKVSDFAPIALVARTPYILVGYPGIPVASVKELIAYAKANPGKVYFGSGGIGGGEHLSGELFNQKAGVHMTHVPYNNSPKMLTDLTGGQIQVAFASMLTTIPLIQAGRIRALAFTSHSRSALLPDVPTVGEAGLPGYESFGFYGLLAPAGTPQPIVDRLNEIVVDALRDPEVIKELAPTGIEIAGGTPKEFGAFIARNYRQNAALIKAVGIKPQ